MANPKIEVEVGAKINEFERKFKDVDKQLDNTGKQFNKLNEFAVGALQGIAAAFTVGAVINFGKAVLDTTAKFQKFEAVLTNTLGSGSEAQIALNQISKFASSTPFQVDELTNAFIKLTNQGFKPTIKELRSLGDLAASTGKSFDQLAEAIIDAQVGEFERLKEFGIRAKKEGDNVKFTFKEVETQVKNTSSSIRGYILSLGDANGVAGATAKISETVGGKISNLEDNIELLRLAIGNKSSGIFAASLDWLNTFVEATTRATKGVAKLREETDLKSLSDRFDSNREAVIELAESYETLFPDLSKAERFAKAIESISAEYREAAKLGEAFRNQSFTSAELDQIISAFDALYNELVIGKRVTKELTEEEKKRAEESKKFYEQTAKFSKDFNDNLLAELSSIRLIEGAYKKLNELTGDPRDLLSTKQISGSNKEAIANTPIGGLILAAQQFQVEANRAEKALKNLGTVDISLPDAPTQPETQNKQPQGLIPQIQKQIELLTSVRDSLTDTGQIDLYNEKIRELQKELSNLSDASVKVGDVLVDAFSAIGNQIAASLNIGNDALKGFVATLLSSTPKIIQAIFKKLSAQRAAKNIETGLNAQSATENAVVSATEAAKGLGPVGLALLPVFIGGALALVSSAFKRSGGGGAVGTSGVGGGVASTFTGGATGGLFDQNREIRGELVARGTDLVYVFNQASDRINKG